MKYWLVKSEPFKYSWDQFVADGVTYWDGVRNYAARNNMQEMTIGEKALYYHSNEGLAIVGIAEITKAAYQDPTTDDTNWVVVDIKPVQALPKPVTLATLKADPFFASMDLIRLGRLSVGRVTPDEYERILQLGGLQ